MDISKIGVIGAGTMGSGIVQAFADAGFDVVMVDMSDAALERGLAVIDSSLERLVTKGKLEAEAKVSASRRIRTATKLEALSDRHMVVEAVSENEALKLEIFGNLGRICQADAILASNTSSISLTRIAAATPHSQRVIGMHFMNPVPVMQLVEVIRALQTSDEVYGQAQALAKKLNKVPVEVQDSPAFLINRLLIPMINEAVFALNEGLASAEDIDSVMKLGANHPIGPLALADLIGLDTCLEIMNVLYRGFDDPKYRPCTLLKQMVDAGYLGRKSGRGFFSYEAKR